MVIESGLGDGVNAWQEMHARRKSSGDEKVLYRGRAKHNVVTGYMGRWRNERIDQSTNNKNIWAVVVMIYMPIVLPRQAYIRRSKDADDILNI